MGAKIPRKLLVQVELMFRMTYLRDKTEDRLLVYADEERNLLLIEVPDMVKRTAEVTCDLPLAIERNGRLWDLVFDLHSHHVMGVFWSPDDNRAERFRGPVFGVCSWLDGWPPAWLFRRWNGEFEALTPEQVIADG